MAYADVGRGSVICNNNAVYEFRYLTCRWHKHGTSEATKHSNEARMILNCYPHIIRKEERSDFFSPPNEKSGTKKPETRKSESQEVNASSILQPCYCLHEANGQP